MLLNRRAFVSGLGCAAVAGCAEPIRDTPEAIQAAFYRSDGPPELVLFTMVRVQTGKGAHTGLLIDGPQRVVFDAAGSYRHPRTPRLNDLHYGITPAREEFYINYHARETYSVRRQSLQVSEAAAAKALALAEASRPVMGLFCTYRTSEIIAQLPGFEGFPVTMFPDVASDAFGAYPGVVTRMFVDDSPDDRSDLGGLGGYREIAIEGS